MDPTLSLPPTSTSVTTSTTPTTSCPSTTPPASLSTSEVAQQFFLQLAKTAELDRSKKYLSHTIKFTLFSKVIALLFEKIDIKKLTHEKPGQFVRTFIPLMEYFNPHLKKRGPLDALQEGYAAMVLKKQTTPLRMNEAFLTELLSLALFLKKMPFPEEKIQKLWATVQAQCPDKNFLPLINPIFGSEQLLFSEESIAQLFNKETECEAKAALQIFLKTNFQLIELYHNILDALVDKLTEEIKKGFQHTHISQKKTALIQNKTEELCRAIALYEQHNRERVTLSAKQFDQTPVQISFRIFFENNAALFSFSNIMNEKLKEIHDVLFPQGIEEPASLSDQVTLTIHSMQPEESKTSMTIDSLRFLQRGFHIFTSIYPYALANIGRELSNVDIQLVSTGAMFDHWKIEERLDWLKIKCKEPKTSLIHSPSLTPTFSAPELDHILSDTKSWTSTSTHPLIRFAAAQGPFLSELTKKQFNPSPEDISRFHVKIQNAQHHLFLASQNLLLFVQSLQSSMQLPFVLTTATALIQNMHTILKEYLSLPYLLERHEEPLSDSLTDLCLKTKRPPTPLFEELDDASFWSKHPMRATHYLKASEQITGPRGILALNTLVNMFLDTTIHQRTTEEGEEAIQQALATLFPLHAIINFVCDTYYSLHEWIYKEVDPQERETKPLAQALKMEIENLRNNLHYVLEHHSTHFRSFTSPTSYEAIQKLKALFAQVATSVPQEQAQTFSDYIASFIRLDHTFDLIDTLPDPLFSACYMSHLLDFQPMTEQFYKLIVYLKKRSAYFSHNFMNYEKALTPFPQKALPSPYSEYNREPHTSGEMVTSPEKDLLAMLHTCQQNTLQNSGQDTGLATVMEHREKIGRLRDLQVKTLEQVLSSSS